MGLLGIRPSKKLVDDLRRNGVATRATVVKVARWGEMAGPGSHDDNERYDPIDTLVKRKTTVRLTAPDGQVVEATARLVFCFGGLPKAGDDIPVLYDPTDHSRLVVDEQTHLMEVSSVDDRPVHVHGGPGDDLVSGDPTELIAAAGYDPAELLRRAASYQADPTAAVPSAAPTGAGEALVAQLEQLSALHDQGVLDHASFEAAKDALLGLA